MKERPILFSSALVRAILDGRKTQTRRVFELRPPYVMDECNDGRPWPYATTWADGDDGTPWMPCPFGEPGDRLWVRETWSQGECDACLVGPPMGTGHCYCSRLITYRADGGLPYGLWRPSIHMPRWASRITLEVTNVRVERLHDISEADALAEGGNSWDGNPWVWAVSFRRVEE